MRKYFLVLVALLIAYVAEAQTEKFSYRKAKKQREEYVNSFLESSNSPLNKKGTKYLDFYPLIKTYYLICDFKPTPDTKPFKMATFNGMPKNYRKYGTIYFKLNGHFHKLAVYESMALKNIPQYKGYLFIPFRDNTNGAETYTGGRYLDINKSDIIEGKVILDFNRAYNPYCAYSGGYSCPVPPPENYLDVHIYAGERKYLNVKVKDRHKW